MQRSKFEAFAVSGDGRSGSLLAAGSTSDVRGSEKICNRASLLLKTPKSEKFEGQQTAPGISAFEDPLIGSTALHLGYSVATLNARHFRLIPGLPIVQL